MKKILAFTALFVSVIILASMVHAENNYTENNYTLTVFTGNNSVCVQNNGACCRGDVCTNTDGVCVEGMAPVLLWCDTDTCIPKVECVKPELICPRYPSTSPDFCKDGGIVPGTFDSNGCQGPPTCVPGGVTCSMPICVEGSVPVYSGNVDSNGCKVYSCGAKSTNTTGTTSYPEKVSVGNNSTIPVTSNVKPVGGAILLPTVYTIPCVKPELYNEMLELERDLRETNSRGEDVSELKAKIESLNNRVREQKDVCAEITKAMPTTAVAVGNTCIFSAELQQAMVDAKSAYTRAIESKDFETAKNLREKLAELEKKSYEERKECMTEIVPGLIKQEDKPCAIPTELYEELENNRYKLSELKKLNTTVPDDLRQTINELESKISSYKARCNAMNVSKDIEEKDVTEYYKNRLSEAMENDNMDVKIEALRDLRKEIDETIKNMIEKKKRLNYSEMEGVADKIEFKANSVSVGDSETNGTEVEVEVETENSSVVIRPTDIAVLLTQEGYNVTADNITVDENGIYVQGVLVKTLPKAVFENNKNLERNAIRMIGMKLDKEGEKAVYTTEYNVKKRLFWIIPANAKYELKIDAENGETLQEKKPWWSGMAKTVKENVEETTESLNETAQ